MCAAQCLGPVWKSCHYLRHQTFGEPKIVYNILSHVCSPKGVKQQLLDHTLVQNTLKTVFEKRNFWKTTSEQLQTVDWHAWLTTWGFLFSVTIFLFVAKVLTTAWKPPPSSYYWYRSLQIVIYVTSPIHFQGGTKIFCIYSIYKKHLCIKNTQKCYNKNTQKCYNKFLYIKNTQKCYNKSEARVWQWYYGLKIQYH